MTPLSACPGGAIGSVAVRAAWQQWSASLGSRPRLAGSLLVLAAYALRLNYRAGTNGSTVSCVKWGFSSEYCRDVCCGKKWLVWLLAVKNVEDMITRFDEIHERDKQTDRHHQSINQFNSRLAARGPNSKWNASEIIHKNNKNQNKQHT